MVDEIALLPLTPEETKARDYLDQVMDECESSAIQYVRAMREYRDKRLYRATHATFDAYLAQRRQNFGTRQRAAQLIRHVEVLDSLAEHGVEVLPDSERQTRELPDDATEQVAAWLTAQSASGQQQPESIWVKGAVETIEQARVTDGHVNTGDGRMTAMDAATIQSVSEAKARQRDYMLAGKKPPLAKFSAAFVSRGNQPETRAYITLRVSDLSEEAAEALAFGTGLVVKIYVYSQEGNANNG